jgi:RNA-directed DNA polymerase
VTDKPKPEQPEAVPETAKRAGEIRTRWDWVEGSVWTERMLEALEQGVKGGRWYSLMDKLVRTANLGAAFREVKARKGAPGVDHVTVKQFEKHLDENLARISSQLRDGTYRPQANRRQWIDKPGSREKRPLGIPTVRDRVTQAALKHVLEPIFEWVFAEHSYGFRPKRGGKDALRRVRQLLAQGYVWVVDADIRSYYDRIPKKRLLERVAEKVADSRVLKLLSDFLNQEIMEGLKHWTPEEGTPQGAVISPLLSNIYLNPLDHLMAEAGYQMTRYADDFVIQCKTIEQAQEALAMVHQWMTENQLELHPEKTRIADAREAPGFDFLGYHFERGYKWPRRKSLRKIKDSLRGKTKRSRGDSLGAIIADVNSTLRGWFQYFKHSHRTTFPPLDGWLRERLRSILRKRHKRTGRATGKDHLRWPNVYFAKQGLFSLELAHAQACQSSCR